MKNLIYFIAALLFSFFSFFSFFSSCEKTKKNNGVSKGDFKDLKPLQNKSGDYENVYFNIDSLQFEHIKDYAARLEKSPSNLILYEYLTNKRTSYGIKEDNYLFIGKDSINEEKIKEYHRQKQAVYRVKHPNIAIIKLYNGSYLVYKQNTFSYNEIYLLIPVHIENNEIVVYRKETLLGEEKQGVVKDVKIEKIDIYDEDLFIKTTSAIIIKMRDIENEQFFEIYYELDNLDYLDIYKSDDGKYYYDKYS